MSAEDVMLKFQEEYNWDDWTALRVCLEYIENQKDNEAFRRFL